MCGSGFVSGTGQGFATFRSGTSKLQLTGLMVVSPSGQPGRCLTNSL